MSRHHEKGIRDAQEVVASVGARPEPAEPMTREQIESFVKGFGMSASATRLMVDRWVFDAAKARDAGWESHADSVWYDA